MGICILRSAESHIPYIVPRISPTIKRLLLSKVLDMAVVTIFIQVWILSVGKIVIFKLYYERIKISLWKIHTH